MRRNSASSYECGNPPKNGKRSELDGEKKSSASVGVPTLPALSWAHASSGRCCSQSFEQLTAYVRSHALSLSVSVSVSLRSLACCGWWFASAGLSLCVGGCFFQAVVVFVVIVVAAVAAVAAAAGAVLAAGMCTLFMLFVHCCCCSCCCHCKLPRSI